MSKALMVIAIIFLTVVLMILIAGPPAHAVSADVPIPRPKCISRERVINDVKTWPYVTTVVSMNMADTREFLAVYNAELPKSSYTAESSLAIMPTNIPVVVWVPFRDGCAAATLTFTKKYFMELYKKGNI